MSITRPAIRDNGLELIVEKTRLFHKNVEVVCVDRIERNEAGKAILNR